jgi:glyoxylase-like metal-dependent hydrolase (beta-lactamase superfamily II)
MVDNAAPDETVYAPALSFLLQHSHSGEKFITDLGIRKDVATNAPPAVQERSKLFKPVIPQDVVESLAKGGTKPEDIKHICLTHLHWDHIGDTHPFKNAQFVVGGHCRKLLSPAYPGDPDSLFAVDTLPEGRTLFISPNDTIAGAGEKRWFSVGPFPHAYDYFGDGSLYVIDAPGHLPGHVNVLARTSSDGAWIYLAGDTAHDWRLLRGQSEIACKRDGHGHVTMCMHADPEAAKITMERVSKLLEHPKVRVVLAHDNEFWDNKENRKAFWPGVIPSL